MAGFPFNFFTPLSFNPQFVNVSLALDSCNFACQSLTHLANYFVKQGRRRRGRGSGPADSGKTQRKFGQNGEKFGQKNKK